MSERVEMQAPCPACGVDCWWNGTVAEPGGATAWRINCNECPVATAEIVEPTEATTTGTRSLLQERATWGGSAA